MHCRKLFSPIFDNNSPDLVVSGRTSRYAVHPPDNDYKYPIVIGGGSKDGSRTVMQFTADENQL